MFLLFGGGIGLLRAGRDRLFHLFPPLIVPHRFVAAKQFWARSEAVAAFWRSPSFYLTWGALLALLEELINQGPMWLFAPLASLIILPALIEPSR